MSTAVPDVGLPGRLDETLVCSGLLQGSQIVPGDNQFSLPVGPVLSVRTFAVAKLTSISAWVLVNMD